MQKVDEAFIDLLKKGDEKAFRKLISYCEKNALYYTRNPEDAKDVASEAITKIIKVLPDYKVKMIKAKTVNAAFKGWVRTVIYHCFCEFLDETKNEVPFELLNRAFNLDDDESAAIKGSFQSIDNMISMKSYRQNPYLNNPMWQIYVKEVIAILAKAGTPEDRIVLLLKYLHDFKISEIAALMKDNPDRTNTLIDRAKKAGRGELTKGGVEGLDNPADFLIKHRK